MKRFPLVLVVVSVALAAAPAFADVTIKMSNSYTGGPMAMEMTMVTSIKGQKMRVDIKGVGQDMSMFTDAVTKQQVLVNHVTKQVQNVGAGVESMPMSFGDVAVSIKPTGQTKDVLGRTCAGYTFEVSMPMTIKEETLMLAMSGMVWIAKDGPGVSEYKEVEKAIAAAGLKDNPYATGPQNKAMAEMAAVIAGNGIPMEQELRISITGTGELAQKMSQMANTQIVTKVTAISVDAIADDLFVVPADYTKK